VGARTASALVRRFGGVAGMLSRVDEIEPEKLRQSILDLSSELPLWRDLTRLRDDVPLPEGPRWSPLPSRQRLREQFEALEFRSLIPRLAAI
jgi:hypothetical protein